MEGLERGIGVLVPSSNRTVERVTEAILGRVPGIAACYARIPLYGDGRSGGQRGDGYDVAPILEAADLLAHARVELICWNGTKGAGLGFAPDHELLQALGERTGIAGVSTALATLDLLARWGVRRIGLLSPGTEAAVDGIARGFATREIEVVARRAMGVTDNFACAALSPHLLAEEALALARSPAVEAVLIWNTNARGFGAMADVEAQVDVPVFDSCAIGVWACLDALGVVTDPLADLGRLFRTRRRSSETGPA
jgi:maleate isomerase